MGKFFASLTGKIVLAALAIGLVLLTLNRCDAARQANTRAELGEGQAGAAAANAGDAIATTGNVAGNAAEGDRTTMENADAIDQAEGSGDAVNPAVRDAGLDSLCRRAAYRDVAECVRRAAAEGVAGAGAGGAAPGR